MMVRNTNPSERVNLREIAAALSSARPEINLPRRGVIDTTGKQVAPDPKSKFEFEPVSPTEFIMSKEFYGDEEDHRIWPWIVEDLEEIFSGNNHEPKYNAVIFISGIGSGKSTFVAMAYGYMAYWLHCLKDPPDYFGLARETTIAMVNLAPAANSAKDVIFNKVMGVIKRVKFFEGHGYEPDKDIESKLVFNKKRILIIPGNSSKTFSMSYDYYGGVIDEACRFETQTKDPVQSLFEGLDSRRDSRFHDRGIIFMVSEAGSEGCFAEQYALEHEGDTKVYFKRRYRYDCQPGYTDKTGRYICFKDEPRFPLTIKRERMDGTEEVLDINPPLIMKPEYDKNLAKALRIINGIPSLVIDKFYLDNDWVGVKSHVNMGRPDPFPDPNFGRKFADYEAVLPSRVMAALPDWFRGKPGIKYYIHVDLAKSDVAEMGQCAAGFAMAHGEENRVVVDLCVRFVAEKNTTLNYQHVRDLIGHLRNVRAFEIGSVTFDQWQSDESIRILKEEQYFSEVLPVGLEQHETLKELLTVGRCDIFDDKEALWELRGLEDKINDVKPATGFMKDEADALAGAVWGVAAKIDKDHEIPKKRAKLGRLASKPGRGIQFKGSASAAQNPWLQGPRGQPPGSTWRH